MKILTLPFVVLSIAWRRFVYSNFASTVRLETYRMLGAKIGNGVRIRPGVLLKGVPNITIGDNCYLGEGTIIVGYGGKVTIGRDVLIAENVYISSRNHRFRDRTVPIMQQGYKGADVTIHDNVWLAHGAIVLAGQVLPSGTVVGAGTVALDSADAARIHRQTREFIEFER